MARYLILYNLDDKSTIKIANDLTSNDTGLIVEFDNNYIKIDQSSRYGENKRYYQYDDGLCHIEFILYTYKLQNKLLDESIFDDLAVLYKSCNKADITDYLFESIIRVVNFLNEDLSIDMPDILEANPVNNRLLFDVEPDKISFQLKNSILPITAIVDVEPTKYNSCCECGKVCCVKSTYFNPILRIYLDDTNISNVNIDSDFVQQFAVDKDSIKHEFHIKQIINILPECERLVCDKLDNLCLKYIKRPNVKSARVINKY